MINWNLNYKSNLLNSILYKPKKLELEKKLKFYKNRLHQFFCLNYMNTNLLTSKKISKNTKDMYSFNTCSMQNGVIGMKIFR